MSSQLRLSIYGALATMATSLSLLSVFSSATWLVPVFGGIAIVAGGCALVRQSPLPSALEPIAAAVGVLLWVTVLYAHSVAWLGIIPNGRAFSLLNATARNGFTEIRKLPTPAPPNHGLVMLTVIGVAAIALVVDLMTVTLRRAALSGLPLLALFTVCAATGHHGVGIIAFIASAIGYLWLLYIDNREKVARWGAAVGTGSRARPASAWSTDMASAPAPASLGRQVGAVAIGLGVLVPIFIPGLHTGINKHSGMGAGSGGGSVQTFDPLVRVGADLSAQNSAPVLTYKTTATQPSYLRLTSLDVYDGTSFTENSLSAPSNATASETLPVVAPSGSTIVDTAVDVSADFDAHWLPVQATTVGTDVDSQWRYDPATATIFSATTSTLGLHYTARSVPNQPTATELENAARPESSLGADLGLPNVDPRIKTLTHQITASANGNRYEAALDIQRYFTNAANGFKYDTNIPADSGAGALTHFLFDTKRGFCQQYAAAMTVMARLSGIPARVAVGFTAGKEDPNTHTWTVTTHDAHAWPELWFQGYGWLPFEPTPRGDGQAVTPSYAKGVAGNSGHNGKNGHAGNDALPTKGGGKKTNAGHGLNGSLGRANPDGQTIGGSHKSHRAADITLDVVWVLLILLAIGLVVPGVLRLVVRRRRWRQIGDPAHAAAAAWAELRDLTVDLGLRFDDERSPRQVATGLLAELNPAPETRDALQRLARCEEQSRYAPTPNAPTDLRSDLRAVRDAARQHASGRRRLAALVLPRSAVMSCRRLVGAGSLRAERGLRFISPVRAAMRLRDRGQRERTA